jgi:hypothetical protein
MKQPQKLSGHFCILVIQNGSSAASMCSVDVQRLAGARRGLLEAGTTAEQPDRCERIEGGASTTKDPSEAANADSPTR